MATLLPLTFVVAALTVLNLEGAAFRTMGGLRGEMTADDDACAVLLLLTYLSTLLFVPLVICYILLAARAGRRR